MVTFRTHRRRRWLGGAIAAALIASLAAVLLSPMLEHAVRERIESAAARGLRPAAHHYFGREPQELTAAQMAFLVAMIPGPIKYQRSFARGTPGPGLRSLIDDLLAKLRSVHAIGEEEYQQALSEHIVVAGGRQPG